MTSRDARQREFTDPVDVMIRWVLQEDVANSSPPSEMWERIKDRLIWRASNHERVRWWPRFQGAARDAFLWLIDSPPNLVGEYAYCHTQGYWKLRESRLRLLVYQGDVPLLLSQLA